MDDSLVGKNLGPYEILSLLGRGPNSVVYRAYHAAANRTVAIKVLPQDFLEDKRFQERFEKDIQRLADLNHPHILPLYDAGQASGHPYLVMRYMGGGTLGDLMVRYGELGLPEAVPIIQQIASALDYAHKQGVIHRFLKPSNILLDQQGNAYITDFGVAPVREAIITASQSGILSGAGYVSPEVISAGKNITGAADVYSLGVILFEMLTGRLPFVGTNAADTARQHLTSRPPAPRSINEKISTEVEKVMLKALSKDPRDRYQTAGAMAEALSEAAGITTSAVRSSLPPEDASGEFRRPPVPAIPPRPPGASLTPPMGIKRSIELEPETPSPGSLKAIDSGAAKKSTPATGPEEPLTPPPRLPAVVPASGGGGASGGGVPPGRETTGSMTPPPSPGTGTPISWKDLPSKERRRLQRERKKARRELQRKLGLGTRWYTGLMAVLLVIVAWFVIGVLIGYDLRRQQRNVTTTEVVEQATPTAEAVTVAETSETPTQPPVLVPSSTPTATATGTPTPTPTVTPTMTPTQIGGSQGMVAFISERDGEPELYVLQITTQQVTALTQNNSLEGWPVWSPDAKLIAYFSSETSQGQHIYVIDPLSFERTELTHGIRVDSYPIWSPQGDQIAFHSYDSNRSFIRTVTLNGEEETLVQIPAGENRLFHWSDEEDVITYFGYSSQGSLDILRLDMDTYRRTPITNANGNVEFISYSPDGSQILFTNYVGGRRQIFISDNSPICAVITDCNTERVTQDTSNWSRPRFSPDGTRILAASDRLGNLDLYILTLAGEILEQLTDSPANDYDGVWQPVGGEE